MPIPETYVKLVSRLINLTREHKLSWERASSLTLFQFKATIGDSGVEVEFVPEDFQPFVKLSIKNDSGEEVDSFEVPLGRQGFDEMKELWDAARRMALRVDETITGLEQRLEKLARSEGDP